MIDYREILRDMDVFLEFLLKEFPEALKYEEKWRKYHMKIIEENEKASLVSKKDIYFIARKHFTDSLLISRCIKESSVTDIGSGAGFPGIPIAILNPEREIYLIERNLKKAIFLKEVKICLNLKSLRVVREDIVNMEEIPGEALVTRAADYESILKVLKKKKIKSHKFYAVIPFSQKSPFKSFSLFNPLTQENFKIIELEL